MEACPKVSAFEQCVFTDEHYEVNWSSKVLIYDVFSCGMQVASRGGSNPVDTQWQEGIERAM
jgi:hypothetical protein